MVTIDFRAIGIRLLTITWRLLIITFHLVRTALIFMLGMLMAFYAMLMWETWGILVMFIVVISMTDWFIGVYYKRWVS